MSADQTIPQSKPQPTSLAVEDSLTESFIPGTIGGRSLPTGRGDTQMPSVSRADLQRELLARAPGMRLYKYGTSWHYAEFGGSHFMFPPDLPGHPLKKHPITGKMVPADGCIQVRDRYGIIKDRRTFRDAGYQAVPGEAAMDAVLFFLAEHAQDGIVCLDGENDEGRKAASKALVHRARRHWAENEGRARAEFLENWQRQPQNKGRLPPPPTRQQNDAQELLDELRSEGRSGMEHICEHGDYETNDFAKYQRHMLVNHSKRVEDPSTAQPVDMSRTISNIERAIAESKTVEGGVVTMSDIRQQADAASGEDAANAVSLAAAAEAMAADAEALAKDAAKQQTPPQPQPHAVKPIKSPQR